MNYIHMKNWKSSWEIAQKRWVLPRGGSIANLKGAVDHGGVLSSTEISKASSSKGAHNFQKGLPDPFQLGKGGANPPKSATGIIPISQNTYHRLRGWADVLPHHTFVEFTQEPSKQLIEPFKILCKLLQESRRKKIKYRMIMWRFMQKQHAEESVV